MRNQIEEGMLQIENVILPVRGVVTNSLLSVASLILEMSMGKISAN